MHPLLVIGIITTAAGVAAQLRGKFSGKKAEVKPEVLPTGKKPATVAPSKPGNTAADEANSVNSGGGRADAGGVGVPAQADADNCDDDDAAE